MPLILESNLPGLELIRRGKVRDVYAVGADKLLIVASDRISAFDVVMADPIPSKGAVLTKVWGRHGFNQELHYTFNTGTDSANNYGGTGTADAFAFNSAYLFRIEPEAYTSESTGAWYFTAEMNGLYETNGDTELRFSPGLMYEGRDFGFEVMGQVPIYADVHHRAPLQWSIGVGVRFLF